MHISYYKVELMYSYVQYVPKMYLNKNAFILHQNYQKKDILYLFNFVERNSKFAQ